jgi:acyl transferase domain-containing protein
MNPEAPRKTSGGSDQNPVYRDRLQRALTAIDALAHRLEQAEADRREPIAVIGMGCRFPGGVQTPESFWHFLSQKKDAVGRIPPGRWDADTWYDPNPDAPGRISTRYGSFLENMDGFDSQFFGITPRESEHIDPQHRLVLEVAWEALEDAGIIPRDLSGTATGVFIGIATVDYFQRLLLDTGGNSINAYDVSGSSHSAVAGRLSHFLNLQGPCMALDSACSSSLFAVHLACQSLRSGESDLAFAGGVNLILHPVSSIFLTKAHMLSPDGRCKTFDTLADGYGRGEGCGVVVLKRLRDAIKDNDRIWAVVRGSAVNHDGRSSGLTVPNGPAQQAVIRTALANAGAKPEDIHYIEAHGTGTAIGDPIEVHALAAVFGNHPLRIGSVKSHIGHLEAAAGIAGFIKTVLAIAHGQIPPSLHFSVPNPRIDWPNIRLTVNTDLCEWPVPDQPHRAGLSSFGFSGINAHVVLEACEYTKRLQVAGDMGQGLSPSPCSLHPDMDRHGHLLMLSARSIESLRALAQRYLTLIATHPQLDLSDLCFSANVSRTHFTHRLALIAHSLDGVQAGLSDFIGERHASTLWTTHAVTSIKDLQIRVDTHSDLSAETLPKQLAQRYIQGESVDLSDFYRNCRPRIISLPFYPFQRRSYWYKQPDRPLHILTLSADSAEKLKNLAAFHHRFVSQCREASQSPLHASSLFSHPFQITDYCYSVNRRQPEHPHRLCLISDSPTQIEGGLNAFLERKKFRGLSHGVSSQEPGMGVVFMFTPQGFEHQGMGQELYRTQPIFRQTLDACDALLQPIIHGSLLEILYPSHSDVEDDRLNRTKYRQPALCAIELALFALWESWGILPAAVIGHSLSEIPAACAAGVFSLSDAMKLVAVQASLFVDRTPAGKMIAVFANASTIEKCIGPMMKDLSIAAYNGPEDIMLSGLPDAVDAAGTALAEAGIRVEPLIYPHAFHSRFLEPMLAELATTLQSITFSQPRIPILAGMTGQVAGPDIATSDYWLQRLCRPVHFADCLQTLCDMGFHTFLEIGPNPMLSLIALNNHPEHRGLWLPSLLNGRNDWRQMLRSLAELYLQGERVDWEGFDQPFHRFIMELPVFRETEPEPVQFQTDTIVPETHADFRSETLAPLFRDQMDTLSKLISDQLNVLHNELRRQQ